MMANYLVRIRLVLVDFEYSVLHWQHWRFGCSDLLGRLGQLFVLDSSAGSVHLERLVLRSATALRFAIALLECSVPHLESDLPECFGLLECFDLLQISGRYHCCCFRSDCYHYCHSGCHLVCLEGLECSVHHSVFAYSEYLDCDLQC